MDHDGHDERLLLAIEEARSITGFEGASLFGSGFSNRDVLKILKAPGLPICLAWPLRDAELEGHFDRTETATGFAGAAVCKLSLEMRLILRMRPGTRDQLKAERLAKAKRLASTKRFASALAAIDAVLQDVDIETLWSGWKIDVSFKDYVRTTRELASCAGRTADELAKDAENRRASIHHPEGSTLERFVRGYLVQAFDEIYGKRKRGFARDAAGGYGTSPLLLFTSAFFAATDQICPSPETIHRALRPSTKRRKGSLRR